MPALGFAHGAIAPIAPAVALGPRPYVGPLAGVPQLVAHPNGAVTPADEPAVVAARADHLAAKGHAFHAAIASGPGYAHPIAAPIAAPIGIAHPVGYAGPLHIPQLVAHPNGAVVPADEPAVVAAKADHFRAKGLPVAGPIGLVGHGLVAHPNGALVPAEPADVVAARADHLATHG